MTTGTATAVTCDPCLSGEHADDGTGAPCPCCHAPAAPACVHCGCTRAIVRMYAAADDVTDAICCLTADAPDPAPNL